MKKGSNLYAYLETAGVLQNGTKEDILQAKKEYWAIVRKEWQQQKRKASKSYTVLFTQAEYKEIATIAKGKNNSITGFIKQSALQNTRNNQEIDAITIGKVREAFFEAYNAIEDNEYIESLFITLEQKILNLLRS